MKQSRVAGVEAFLSELSSELAKLTPEERRRNLADGATFVAERPAQRAKPVTSASAPAKKVSGRAGR